MAELRSFRFFDDSAGAHVFLKQSGYRLRPYDFRRRNRSRSWPISIGHSCIRYRTCFCKCGTLGRTVHSDRLGAPTPTGQLPGDNTSRSRPPATKKIKEETQGRYMIISTYSTGSDDAPLTVCM